MASKQLPMDTQSRINRYDEGAFPQLQRARCRFPFPLRTGRKWAKASVNRPDNGKIVWNPNGERRRNPGRLTDAFERWVARFKSCHPIDLSITAQRMRSCREPVPRCRRRVFQGITFTQDQSLTIEVHDGGAAIQGIGICFLGQFHSGHIGLGVIDDEIHTAILTILAGVAVDMGALGCRDPAVIYSGSHQGIPQQDSEIVGTGLKAAMLQPAVVRGSQGVMEDNTAGMVLVALAYPVFKRVLKNERAKIAPEILRLADELIK